MNHILSWAIILPLASGLLPVVAQSSQNIDNLRCEYLTNPVGIDVANPRLSWNLPAGPRDRQQSAYQILVSSSEKKLANGQGDIWNSGRIDSKDSVNIPYGGSPLTSRTLYFWKVRAWDQDGHVFRWSQPATFSVGLLHDSDWYASFIGLPRPTNSPLGVPLPFPWLRKTFSLKQKPRRATAYVNALGYFELYVNGKKVNDSVLNPAVSDYSKRTYYLTYDISNYLSEGPNCIALWLGRGWYVRGHPGVIHDGPLVRAQIDIDQRDGQIEKIGTDATWKVHASPITPLGKGTAFGDYGGEHYDARQELKNWNAVQFDDADWQPAALFDPPHTLTSAQMVQTNRIQQTIHPVNVQEITPGEYLIDMGRNFVGWLELVLPSKLTAGRQLRLEYADASPTAGALTLPVELRRPDIRPANQARLRNRYMTYNQRDEYITGAGAGQVFRSRFNYHGFQYVHVTGLEQKPKLSDIKGYQIRTDYPVAASFESSNALLNQIYHMVTWTYENLTLGGYVVDCPTRERLGYGGDAGTSLETGMFNFDTSALYTKWLNNWHDEEHPNGDLPYTAPAYPEQGGGGPMWSGFTVTLPWQIFLQYGDRRILATSYPYIKKWLDFLDTKTTNGLLQPYVSYGITPPQWNFLGDWVTPGSDGRSRDPQGALFINNCHYLYQLQIAAKIAALLHKEQESAQYQQKSAMLAHAIHGRFFNVSKQVYVNGEQAYQAFPLLLHMVPDNLRETVMKNLEKSILITNHGHLDSGMHGTYFLLKELMEADRNDLIYTFTSKTDYPSWGFLLKNGATTMWESWSGGTHIHDTLISIGSWFIEGIGGIRIDEQSPGFAHFFIKSAVVGDLTFARTKYDSIHGWVVSNWSKQNGVLYLDVTVPPGTTATISIPDTAPDAVTEEGRSAAKAQGVHAARVENGKAVFDIGSGHYRFASPLSH